ncbi:MAG: TIGR00730 family Rossman fold protein [Bryobacteraceae bacterium]
MRRLCVFCGSSFGSRPIYREAALEVGRGLARRGIGLVYGGASVGLMGALADAALEAGGEVIGVIPRALVEKEIAHRGLSELCVVESMHERKARMAERADAFLALPGGFGTLEEVFETLAWRQLRIHRKPCGLLNTAGYYDGLLAMLDHAAAEGFLRPENRALLVSDSGAERLIERLLGC